MVKADMVLRWGSYHGDDKPPALQYLNAFRASFSYWHQCLDHSMNGNKDDDDDIVCL